MLAVLERVRQRVVDGDWRNHGALDGYKKGNPGCLIQLVAQEDTILSCVITPIVEELPYPGIITWNDNPSRTAQDVIDLLDRVIARQINGQN